MNVDVGTFAFTGQEGPVWAWEVFVGRKHWKLFKEDGICGQEGLKGLCGSYESTFLPCAGAYETISTGNKIENL